MRKDAQIRVWTQYEGAKKVSSRPQSFPKQGGNEVGLARACSLSCNASKLSNARSIINFEGLELEIGSLEVKPNLQNFQKSPF